MVINVSDILKEYGKKVDINSEIQMDNTDFLGEQFTFDEPLSIVGSIVNNGKALELNAVANGNVKVHCARCYKELCVYVDFPVHEILAQGDNGEVSLEDDIMLFSGYSVDIKDIVANNFLMNISGKYLCSEDCKGLCSHCGKDLNEGECNCQGEEIDPRWGQLTEIMKNSSAQ